MNTEEKAWLKAVAEDMKKHQTTAPETREMFKTVEAELKAIKELMLDKFGNNEKEHGALQKMMDNKASKWTEKALIVLMTGVFVWVLNQVLNLIPTVKAFL